MDLTYLTVLLVVITPKVCAENSKVSNNGDEEKQTFIPTHEWQVIRDGQVVPAGLHYRMNLQTGLKEAKLLDESSKVSNPRSAIILAPHNTENNHGELEELNNVHRYISTSNEKVDQEHIKFRSYEYLKKEFQDLNLLIKTDLELIGELVARFRLKNVAHEIDEQEIITILTDLEYLVHHYDNAQEFAHIGGFTHVVYTCLNASSVAIRSEAIRLLGSAIQSNPKLQIMALEIGSISLLLRILVLDNSPVIRARAIYALSCLIRRFPVAQLKMINGGGLSVLGDFFQNEGQDDLKLQVKVVTLLYDLVMEHKYANEAIKVPSEGLDLQELEKQRQYNIVNLPQHLVEAGWCRRLPKLLMVSASNSGQIESVDDLSTVIGEEDLPVQPEHDVVEKVVEAMLALVEYCMNDFKSDPDAQNIVLSLKKWYSELSVREELGKESRNSSENSDHYYYYTSLAKRLQELAREFNSTKD